MLPLIKQAQGLRTLSLSFFSRLVDRCLYSKSAALGENVHAQLIKVGLIHNTFLGNRCLDLYFRLGAVTDALKLFDDMPEKNTFSWNILLKGLLRTGDFDRARYVFDEMPERDVVSWNTMISGSASCGFCDYAIEVFSDMQRVGVKPSEFTFSIATSLVSCAVHGKQIHGRMIRSGMSMSNVVIWNSLIDMYGKFGLVDYGLGVFLVMEDLDTISWNSLISCCVRSDNEQLGLLQFSLMRSFGYDPDEYTVSTVMTACSELQNLDMGKQIFALSIKMGFLANTIVSSATIDMFSKCNRLEDSFLLFEELRSDDPALCNSIIAAYSWHGFAETAIRIFVLALRQNLRPDKFTVSSILSSISILLPDHGNQLHSLTIKLGFDSELVVATSLIEMYNKIGLVDSAVKIFDLMNAKDLICWNTMVTGLARNGRATESLNVFHEQLRYGASPDQLTFFGVLLACSSGGFVNEAFRVLSLMRKEFGVNLDTEHCICIVDLLCRTNMLKEATVFIESIPFEPDSVLWEPVLCSSVIQRDLWLAETVAKKMINLEPKSVIPYSVLAWVYEITGRWEDMIRIRFAMNKLGMKQTAEQSQIGIRNNVYSFNADLLQHHGGDELYSILKLLSWDSEENFSSLL